MDKPVLCYVTDRSQLAGGRKLSETIGAAIAAGVDWVQIREKDWPTRELLALVHEAVARAAGQTTRILVNDRLDAALAAGAHGVHLGSESMPVKEVVRWCRKSHLPENFLIGASCHSVQEVAAAEQDGASYAILGPVFATPSKERFGPPLGVQVLAEACRAVKIPVLAIGGVTVENARACFEAGAAGLAAIRLFQEAQDLSFLVDALHRL